MKWEGEWTQGSVGKEGLAKTSGGGELGGGEG